MSGGADVLVQARALSQAPYDRQALTDHLGEKVHELEFARRYDDARMLSAAQATFNVLDDLDGFSLADRWIRFEADVWPRWQAGQDRLALGARWGFGVWALVVCRLVQPAWGSISQVRIGQWTELLPADDPIRIAQQQLMDTSASLQVGAQGSHTAAVNMATRLMLARGIDTLDDLTEDDLLALPAGIKGADVLDAMLCQLGVFDRTPRRGTTRRRTAPRHRGGG